MFAGETRRQGFGITNPLTAIAAAIKKLPASATATAKAAAVPAVVKASALNIQQALAVPQSFFTPTVKPIVKPAVTATKPVVATTISALTQKGSDWSAAISKPVSAARPKTITLPGTSSGVKAAVVSPIPDIVSTPVTPKPQAVVTPAPVTNQIFTNLADAIKAAGDTGIIQAVPISRAVPATAAIIAAPALDVLQSTSTQAPAAQAAAIASAASANGSGASTVITNGSAGTTVTPVVSTVSPATGTVASPGVSIYASYAVPTDVSTVDTDTTAASMDTSAPAEASALFTAADETYGADTGTVEPQTYADAGITTDSTGATTTVLEPDWGMILLIGGGILAALLLSGKKRRSYKREED